MRNLMSDIEVVDKLSGKENVLISGQTMLSGKCTVA